MATKTDNDVVDDNLQDDADTSDAKGKKKNKKDKKDKKNKKDKDGKKKNKLIPLLFLAIIIGGLVAIIGFNAGGIRDKYLRGTLEKIPVVKNLLPAQETGDEFSNLSKDELTSQARKLSEENTQLTNQTDELNKQIEQLNAEMTRLKEIEANQLAFNQEKEQFDTMIAENDPSAYKTFYESIEPETAQNIYREIVNNQQTDKQLQQYVKNFENMKADAASKVLTEMMGTDMDLVVQILNNTSNDQTAKILAAMDPADAASCARMMAPQQNNN